MFTVKTYLKESPGKGLGTFAKKFIPKGATIWDFDIKVHKSKLKELSVLQLDFINTYFWQEGDYFYSSCDHSTFQNHSYDPNSIPQGDYMIAARDIQPDEEITANYQHFDDMFEKYKDILI
jgi:SET domain-containing protein